MSRIISTIEKITSPFDWRYSESEIKKYKSIVKEINRIEMAGKSNEELLTLSGALSNAAREGAELESLLPEAFALVREAARRVLGIRPFDVQLLAGMAMYRGNIAEMQTGEGKTLAAVFCAYLSALQGKGVHVLTFNDYLAKRDAEWMGPIYRFLGLTVGYVKEGMGREERKKAYNADVTYVTAREAGFDFLRSFLCYESRELVQRPFNCAIVDEADSILIDEARIPLIIAGTAAVEEGNHYALADIARTLRQGVDYDMDDNGRNIFLTDSGADLIEDRFRCGNLYDDRNIQLLCAVNSALHAEVFFKKNIDYIVRSGRIELVDEFTGRIADKRHWPEGLQTAVEAKEGLEIGLSGRIMGSISLQNFLDHYPRLCGMTATAKSSAEELRKFYGLNIVEIPTNKPCIRTDHPDVLFTHKAAKYKAVVEEVRRVHSAGRPVLIGTASVEESDMLAGMLAGAGIECSVLNAKNDELEAKIIAGAGGLGAVTVSTNMAGRGTDIRLGGEDERNRDEVTKLGGLYVIGTNLHESVRIDNQLRGRAGRQGDSGASRFFISMEDDLIVRFGVKRALPSKLQAIRQEGPLDNILIRDRIAHIQRVVEGQNFEIRNTLGKYASVIEEQRKIIHKKRQQVLKDELEPGLLALREPERYNMLLKEAGSEILHAVEKRLTLFYLDQCWADYLDYSNYIREGIHLVTISGKNPMDEFICRSAEAFQGLGERIENEIIAVFNRLKITKAGVDFDKEGLKGPTSTWTYVISDDYFKNNPGLYMQSNRNIGFASVGIAILWPLTVPALVFNRFRRKKKQT